MHGRRDTIRPRKPPMLGIASRADHVLALDRVTAWTRERFGLSPDVVIMVSEVACALPGCPPLETIVVFWTENQTRHHFKLFKRAVDVVIDDLPFAWMRKSLAAATNDYGCC